MATITAAAFTFLVIASAASALISARNANSDDTAMVIQKLIGPGSSPPICRSKCGPCAPCRPVQVPVKPGLSQPLEYYPEAWRCKCGNSLFIP